MSIKETKYISSLYDTVLDKVLGNTIMAFFYGEPGRCWDALLTLRDVLVDSKIKEEVQKLIDSVQMEINKQMSKRGYAQSDVLQKQRILRNYVNEQKHKIFDRIMTLLSENGYLDRTTSPRYGRPPKPLGTEEE